MVNEWDKDEADSLKGRLSATELMNIVQTTKGNGVLTGMDVTEDSPASMNVDIAAGTFIANNVYRSYGGGAKRLQQRMAAMTGMTSSQGKVMGR